MVRELHVSQYWFVNGKEGICALSFEHQKVCVPCYKMAHIRNHNEAVGSGMEIKTRSINNSLFNWIWGAGLWQHFKKLLKKLKGESTKTKITSSALKINVKNVRISDKEKL